MSVLVGETELFDVFTSCVPSQTMVASSDEIIVKMDAEHGTAERITSAATAARSLTVLRFMCSPQIRERGSRRFTCKSPGTPHTSTLGTYDKPDADGGSPHSDIEPRATQRTTPGEGT